MNCLFPGTRVGLRSLLAASTRHFLSLPLGKSWTSLIRYRYRSGLFPGTGTIRNPWLQGISLSIIAIPGNTVHLIRLRHLSRPCSITSAAAPGWPAGDGGPVRRVPVCRRCHRFAPEWRRAPEWSGQEPGAVLTRQVLAVLKGSCRILLPNPGVNDVLFVHPNFGLVREGES
jgi:hypothetical protein